MRREVDGRPKVGADRSDHGRTRHKPRSNGVDGVMKTAMPATWRLRLQAACVAQLHRLALRHEDSINIGKIEVSYVAHFRIDTPNSLVKCIFAAAEGWRKASEENPASISKPLRSTLFSCVLMELRTHIKEISEAQIKHVQDLGWYDPATQVWAYLRWNPESRALEKDLKRPGSTSEAITNALDWRTSSRRRRSHMRWHDFIRQGP